MFTWGPQSSEAPPPPPPAPEAGFYGLVSSGTPSYTVFNVFAGSADFTVPLSSGAIAAAGVFDAQQAFLAATGAGDPNDFESATVTADGTLTQVVTDPATGLDVTIAAATGGVAEETPGTTDNGRYSVPWINAASTISAAGTKYLKVITSGQTVTFTFDEPMCGFGLYLTDYLDFGGTCTWAFYSGATLLDDFVVEPLDGFGSPIASELMDGGAGFVGFVANSTAAPFDSMTMTFSSTASDRTGFDNIFQATLAGRPVLSITAGDTVQFTDTSTGTPTSWLWNFGDSTTSTSQNPTKTYSTPGTYTVSLQATNAGGSDTETKTGLIVVS